jgi:hypothetical protein
MGTYCRKQSELASRRSGRLNDPAARFQLRSLEASFPALMRVSKKRLRPQSTLRRCSRDSETEPEALGRPVARCQSPVCDAHAAKKLGGVDGVGFAGWYAGVCFEV